MNGVRYTNLHSGDGSLVWHTCIQCLMFSWNRALYLVQFQNDRHILRKFYYIDSVSVSIFRMTLLGYYAEGMHANFKKIYDLNTSNDGASAIASPFHALIVLGEKTNLHTG